MGSYGQALEDVRISAFRAQLLAAGDVPADDRGDGAGMIFSILVRLLLAVLWAYMGYDQHSGWFIATAICWAVSAGIAIETFLAS